MTPSGTISTVAGGGMNGFIGDGGPATSAALRWPMGVAVDAKRQHLASLDNINRRVRKVTASTGYISTIAGNGTQGYSGDGGAATSAELSGPAGLAVDTLGNVYFADGPNARVREVVAYAPAATITWPTPSAINYGTALSATQLDATATIPGTFAYTPAAGAIPAAGTATLSAIFTPQDTTDYSPVAATVSLVVNGTAPLINTVAGNGTAGFAGDGGAATSAELYGPNGVAFDTAGNMYIGDSYNNRIPQGDPGGPYQHGGWKRHLRLHRKWHRQPPAQRWLPEKTLWTDPGTSISPILITMSSAR